MFRKWTDFQTCHKIDYPLLSFVFHDLFHFFWKKEKRKEKPRTVRLMSCLHTAELNRVWMRIGDLYSISYVPAPSSYLSLVKYKMETGADTNQLRSWGSYFAPLSLICVSCREGTWMKSIWKIIRKFRSFSPSGCAKKILNTFEISSNLLIANVKLAKVVWITRWLVIYF